MKQDVALGLLKGFSDAGAGAADGHVVDGVKRLVALERGVAFLKTEMEL